MGETTRGRNDSGRNGKWAKRLGGERESGRNDPDSSMNVIVPKFDPENAFFCNRACTKIDLSMDDALTRETIQHLRI